MHQRRLISYNKCPPLVVVGGGGRGSHAYGYRRYAGNLSTFPSICKLKTALKNKSYLKKKIQYSHSGAP